MGKYTTNVEDKLRFDLYYIRNYSFWLDIVILLKTIIVLFDKTKAEGTESKQQGKSKDIIADAKANNDMNVITDEGYKKAREFGDEIPIGVLYKVEKPTYGDSFEFIKNGEPLVDRNLNPLDAKKLMNDFI